MTQTCDSMVDPAALSHAGRMELLASIEVEQARLAALRVRTLAAIEGCDGTDKLWSHDEAAVVMRVCPATATARMKEATHLVQCLPRTVEALACGELSAGHVRRLVEATLGLDTDTIAAVESRCLDRVAAGYGHTAGQFARIVRRAVAVLDPDSVENRLTVSSEQRRVCFTPQDDGTTELWALLPAEAATRLKACLDRQTRLTKHRPDGTVDPRTADQRRADALADLARTADATTLAEYTTRFGVDPNHADSANLDLSRRTSSGLGADKRIQRHDRLAGPAVHVTVAASTLLGLDDLPGELAGHGPVPASVARTIAADPTGTWHRILTDPAGHPLEVSRAYRPPPTMRRLIQARDQHCRFPGCPRPSTACEIDHLHDHANGGATAPANLQALCARHHHLKHEAPGWTVTRDSDGTTHWHTPTGTIIDVPADRYDDLPTRWPDSLPRADTITLDLVWAAQSDVAA